MNHKVVAPSVGESITEVSILKWAKKSGDAVRTGDVLLEIESDKATVEIIAEASGVLSILKQAGEKIPVGEVIGMIDDAASASSGKALSDGPTFNAPPPAAAAAAPSSSKTTVTPPSPTERGPAPRTDGPTFVPEAVPPSVRRMATEEKIRPEELSQIAGTGKGGRVTKGDVIEFSAKRSAPSKSSEAPQTQGGTTSTKDHPGDRRVPMSRIRAKIAERLVAAQHTAAILTTFNEADMTRILELRSKYKDSFKAKHGVSLGFMTFFARGCIEALKAVPGVNASVDGTDILYHDYIDLGIAVGTDRGLVVPVVRNAGEMGFVEIEKKIAELAIKARDGKLSIAELSGGTFTISNGGVYGSLLSTPILNPPQSGILGMHKIQERPVVIEGKVVARPMMYLALSYDHRLVDGKEAVTFLVTLKEHLEQPEKLGLEFLNG